MTTLIVVGCIVAVLAAIALLRFGAEVEYSEDGFEVIVHVGPAGIKVYPPKQKKQKKNKPKKEKKPKDKKKKADKKEPTPKKKKGGSLDLIFQIIPVVKQTLVKFRHKLLINDLTVHYMAASTDPFKAAIAFGRSSAGLGAIIPVLDNAFRIRRRDIQTAVSFDTSKPYIYIHARFSIALWETFYVAWGMIVFVVKNFILNNRKAAEKNGETSNRRPDGNDNAEDT